jgi:AcrR family transcriptional regulator
MRRPSTYHHGDLRRVVLEATLALVEQEGVGSLSMREIARRAGVSHGAPYHHFHDKAGVMTAIAEEGFQKLEAALRAGVAESETPRGKFEACGRAYVKFAVSHPAHFRVMFRPELAEPALFSAGAKSAFQVLVEVVAECRREGLGRGVAPGALALTGWSTMHGLASLIVDGPFAKTSDGSLHPDQLARTVSRTLGTLLGRAT